MKRISAALFVALLVISPALCAQNTDETTEISPAVDLGGMNSIHIVAGVQLMKPVSAAAVSPGTVSSELNFLGLLGYRFWIDNEWSFNISAGIITMESNVDYTGVSSVSITPLLFGFAYYPSDVSLGNTGRVYVGLDAGVYVRSGSEVGLSSEEFGTTMVSETAFGAAPKVGIDFFVSDWLRLGPVLSYHFVTEYRESIGGRTNNSGPALSLDLGVVF